MPDEEDFVAMIITCPDCATGFKVPEDIFSNGPRKVRCAQCGHSRYQDQPAKADEITDPLEDILKDQSPGAPEGSADEDPAEEFDDFDIAMPEFEKAAEDLASLEEETSPEPESSDEAGENPSGGITPVVHSIESEARGLKRKRLKTARIARSGRRRVLKLAAMAAALALLAGGGIYYRMAVCTYVPALAGLYEAIGLPVNLLGVDFAGVELTRKYENGFPLLSIQGEVVNVSGRVRQVPDVRLGLKGPGGQEIYHWSINVGRTRLGPDQRVKFVTRLASPPEEASKLILKFDTPRQRRLGAL
ncbi:MAG TPA: hypothetical protein ENJ57_04555 [Rhizobiales bacterium]|nr:hypothetical protein [Hyphomicrobiales bacterium]